MSSYAIIQLQGKQYKVHAGDTFVVDKLEQTADGTFSVNDVLLVAQDETLSLGEPLVVGASVSLKVLSHQKGEKIRVAKYKSKSRYRRVYGHRQHQTTLEVVKISL